MSKELALKIAVDMEASAPGRSHGSLLEFAQNELLEFATRYHAAMMEKYGKGFEDAKYDWESHDDWQFADRDAERKFFYQAGAASREPEFQALRDENERLKADSERYRWLRSEYTTHPDWDKRIDDALSFGEGKKLDAAIDAARKEGE